MSRSGEPTMRSAVGLRASAEAVLRANCNGSYTVPARATYPHQWNWDSALAAIGWAELDPARAWLELETLLGAADSRGMVPHIAFRGENGSYSPGPDWWGRRRGRDKRRISGLTQPPLAAICARILFERHPDELRGRALLRPLLDWHRALFNDRDADGRCEPVLIHPWESGRDNAVEWDRPLARVTPQVGSIERPDLESVDASQRPGDEYYRRYLTLVRAGTGIGWAADGLARSAPFRVLDPGFSAITARACLDLGWLAAQLGEDAIAEESWAASEWVSRALRARADSDGLIRPVDLVDESPLAVTGAGSALALLSPRLSAAQVEAARELVMTGALSSPHGVRSLDREHPCRSSGNYWRGPTWANVTWLSALALDRHEEFSSAADLRRRTLRAIEQGGQREYFCPDSGAGLGAQDFTWTAALCLNSLGRAEVARQAMAVLKPGQWSDLLDQLGDIENPVVPTSPSRYSLPADEPASDAHLGE